MRRSKLLCVSVLPLLLLLPAAPAAAQDLANRPTTPPAAGDLPTPVSDEEVTFDAAQLDYDDNANIVTATGDVRMLRAGNRLRADRVIWNRTTGDVRAEGNVAVVNPGGDTAYGDTVLLKDTLRDGVVENLLLVLADGGRLASPHATRVNGVTTLDHAAYTPCRVADGDGCPKEPTWKITALRVVHDPVKARVYYKDARFTLFDVPVLWLPGFSHPDGSSGGGSGLLVPQFQYNHANGAELALPYYIMLAPNRDLTITPHVYSNVLPGIGVQYRALGTTGAFQASGFVTYGSRLTGVVNTPGQSGDRDIRGYIDVNGRWQFGPYWTLTSSVRLTTDRTFLRRYDFSGDDRLRSVIEAERIDTDSYLSIAGYAVQTLRAGASQRQQPIALPAIDWRLRIPDPRLGGVVQVQANSLALIRDGAQDTQRAFAGLRWDLRKLTPLGQEVTFTAYARGDVYHTSDVEASPTVAYRGDPGWSGRVIAALAADMRWPFVGMLAGGTQVITPRVQLVASPRTKNLGIPNEDARAIDLEDSNLFALNRFAGYDRWEDGNRVTYGLDYAYDRPKFAVRTNIGQSYRLTSKPALFPPGTGLDARYSDIVGSTTVQYDRFVSITHRFRIDKDSLALRRNELDLTLGGNRTYVTAGYLRLNRDIDTAIEDLRDREELRAGARVQITKTLSIFGSTIIDLTSRSEDPLSLADGFEPIRHRLGFLYENDCIEAGVTWRRDYDVSGDARRGSTFLLRLALKNLGR